MFLGSRVKDLRDFKDFWAKDFWAKDLKDFKDFGAKNLKDFKGFRRASRRRSGRRSRA